MGIKGGPCHEYRGFLRDFFEGALQVGKQTFAQEFGRNHYKTTLTIDFASASDDLKTLFLELRTDLRRLFLAHLL